MTRTVLLGLILLVGCAREDRAALRRRPLTPAATSGWARLPLDADAQRNLAGAWIGDATGRSIPFLEAREGLWEGRSLPLSGLLLGRNGMGHPTATFTLGLPEGWRVGDRESLRLDLDLEGQAPWVVQVAVARDQDGSGFLTLESPLPRHLYDLSPSGARRSLDLPWEAQRYRLTLIPSQGEAPRIRSLSVRAETRPEALEAELLLEGDLTLEAGQPHTWRFTLPQAERVVGLDLDLAPPAAPLRPEIRSAGWPEEVPCFSQGLAWNLPALGTRATRVPLAPALRQTLLIGLPDGAQPQRVRALVRRQTLLFPAEAGMAYALHLGGRVKPAPGNLGALPPCRTLAAAAALALGPEEPDDQGIPRVEAADQRARPWMPWVAGAAVLLLGAAAWRLFRTSPPA